MSQYAVRILPAESALPGTGQSAGQCTGLPGMAGVAQGRMASLSDWRGAGYHHHHCICAFLSVNLLRILILRILRSALYGWPPKIEHWPANFIR